MAEKNGEYDPWNPKPVKPSKRGKKAVAQHVEHDPETGEIPNEDRTGDDTTSGANTIAAGQLRAFIERIERLEEEKKTVGDDIKEVYAEAKGSGFDPKTIRRIIKLRTLDDATRHEAETMLQLYMDALGMDGGTIV
jgi:uncharacterized protein (UPF0335 family)